MRDSQAAGCGIAFVYAMVGALVVGIPSFLLAFYVSVARHPDSPQGPLLAFVVFGPAGAFVGFAAGGLLSQMRRRK